MRVKDYLDFVADVKGVEKKSRAKHLSRVMGECAIEDRADWLIRNLSKGLRQRVGLAQAVINDPAVLILDEPTLGLDPKQIIEIRQHIKEMAGKRTVILSSHVLPEVSMVCQRVLIINKGEVVAAYERVPLGIIGDGKSTIRMLVQKKLEHFNIHGRKVRVNVRDERIKREVLASGYSFRSILPLNIKLALLPNANLSTGGEGRNVTNTIHPTWRTLAKQLANDVGLTLVGIDFLIEKDIIVPCEAGTWCVLEVNPAPQLHHFSTIGKSEKILVEQLYRRILRDLWEG
jgi:energy-coupling factor transporter ATP-binding protein EcfA2